MERRKALAVASSTTLVLGAVIVATASVSGASFLGFGGSGHNGAYAPTRAAGSAVVVRTRNVYDKYVVQTTESSTPSTGANVEQSDAPETATTIAPPLSAPLPDATDTPPSMHSTVPDEAPPAADEHRGTGDESQPTPTTTVALPTTTTSAPTTTTTWPAGVPADWPPNVPIPPVPPNCREQQLELNGIWNCDH